MHKALHGLQQTPWLRFQKLKQKLAERIGYKPLQFIFFLCIIVLTPYPSYWLTWTIWHLNLVPQESFTGTMKSSLQNPRNSRTTKLVHECSQLHSRWRSFLVLSCVDWLATGTVLAAGPSCLLRCDNVNLYDKLIHHKNDQVLKKSGFEIL